LAVAVNETVKASIEVPPSAQDRPNGNADDKEDRVVALRMLLTTFSRPIPSAAKPMAR